MKHYNTHPDWNKVQSLPEGRFKNIELKVLSHLVKGNLHWFARKLIGFPNDSVRGTQFADELGYRSTFVRQQDFYTDLLGRTT